MLDLKDNPVVEQHIFAPREGEGAADQRPFNLPERRGSGRPSHLFVHTVRFWSMLSIVANHSLFAVSAIHHFATPQAMFLTQPFKFGTIGFFLISGFLMGDRLQACDPWAYLRRRVQRVFLPWIFWSVLLTVTCVTILVARHGLVLHDLLDAAVILVGTFKISVLYSPLWFVPNLMAGLCLMLALRKYLYSLRLGLVLLAVNLVYTANVYTGWLPQGHTRAAFGFVVYLWLGAYCARHLSAMQATLKRISTPMLGAAATILCAVAVLESQLIAQFSPVESTDTLRFSNQAFSVVVVLLLLRIPRRSWPRFIDVGRHTFGIYLAHPLVSLLLIGMVSNVLPRGPWRSSTLVVLPLWIMFFITNYGACLAIAKTLAGTRRLTWLVGLQPTEAAATEQHRPTVRSTRAPADATNLAVRATAIR